ncbi:deoxyguanosinetriphosphate triphosphohydrolase [Candidatus Peregrinibacteria bacterium]|nr:deoxyguanosinetriphosphate triphosphohydrolase [Candidatus Peregrinibacteria bacterium]
MILLRKQLEVLEKKNLAPYAVISAESAGREFSEAEDSTRTEFQRDRDRIIHSKAFRRLSGKTQVFVATYGDHFRDRLSHSLAVAQIARDIARNLRLNEDLCEAIALAHDLGHTPFGHAGEKTLNSIMKTFGRHFEHNEQSKRIVERLEIAFPAWPGLNLTWEARQGLAKHQTVYDQAGRKITGATLEAQVVDLADEIAYHNHDVDDGLRSKLFRFSDLEGVWLWRASWKDACEKYDERLDPAVAKSRTVSRLISLMIQDVLGASEKNLAFLKVRSGKDVLKAKAKIIRFSPPFQRRVGELRAFLWKNMYESPAVLKYSRRGQGILERLFWKMHRRPKLLPRRFYARIDVADPLEVVVKDYVAGCTDEYAEIVLKA